MNKYMKSQSIHPIIHLAASLKNNQENNGVPPIICYCNLIVLNYEKRG